MGIMALMEEHKEIITAWVAIVGVAGSAVKYFCDLEREKTAINIAVLTEVHRLLPVIHCHREWWNSLDKNDKEKLPLIPFSTPVFGGQVHQIGKLDRQVVGSVGAFYGYLGYINQLQTSRKAYLDARWNCGRNREIESAASRVEALGSPPGSVPISSRRPATISASALEIHPRAPGIARNLVERRAGHVRHLAHARVRQQGLARVVAVLVAY